MVGPGTTAVERRSEAAAVAAVALAFAGCAAVSWRRLGSLLIDGGHELEVPRRLLEGQALYRDVRWYWGPLAPWLNSVLYGWFGVSYDTLMWAGLVSAALACAGLFLLARRFVGPATSAAVAIAFVAGSAFAQRIPFAIFNFVAPFNFSATYGMTLAIWSVLLLLRHAQRGDTGTLAASALLAGLVGLTKAETAFAVGGAHLAFLLTILPRPTWARIAAWAAGVAVTALGYLAASRASGGLVWASLRALANPASRFYIASTMGFDDLGDSLLAVALSAAGIAAAVAAAWWAASASRGEGNRPPAAVLVAWGVLAAIPGLLLRGTFLRAAPVVAVGAMAAVVAARLRGGDGALGGRWREHLVLWTFALAALARIPLRAGPDHYGFYLTVPLLACVAVGLSHLPVSPRTPGAARALASCACAVLVGLTADALLASWPHWTRPAVLLDTERVRLNVEAGGAEAAFVPYLSRLPKGTVVAAVPEGAGIVFATGLTPTADGFTTYVPMHVHERADEEEILRAWERRPPALVVYWAEDTRPVFGYAGLGRDYGFELAHWLEARYAVSGPPVGSTVLLAPRGRP